MKKIYLLLALFVAINVDTAFSIPFKNMKESENKPNATIPYRNINNLPELIGNSKDITNKTNALNYANVDTISRATFMTWANINPMAYDQYSDTYFYSAVNYVFTNNQLSGTTNLIKKSIDGGLTWSETPFTYTVNGEIMGYTSIAVANPDKSPTGAVNFVAYTPSYKPNGGTYTLDGGYLYISDGENQDKLDFIKPNVNATGIDNKWGISTSLSSFSDGENSFVSGTNQLFPQGGGQYGLIGTFTMDLPNFTLSSSQIPREWWLDKFRVSDGAGSFNTFTQTSTDMSGNIYAGVYNMFSFDPDNRVPGVSKSTDKGVTWSEFNVLPLTAIRNYWVSLQFPETSAYTSGGYGLLPYRIDGFVAYANDNYSYFFRIAKFIEGTQNEIELCHLVEANYNGTEWKLRKVADLTYTDLPDQITDNPDATGANYEMLISTSSLANEINVAKTADGQHIIVKWIDIKPGGPYPLSVSQSMKIERTNANTGQPEVVDITVDTLNSTDVFFAYRGVDDNNWSSVINATDDMMYDKGTYLPKMVKNINNVAFMKTETVNGSYSSINLTTKDPLVTQRIIDLNQFIRTTKIDLLNITSVEETTPLDYRFNLNEVFPNPAMEGNVEFTYSSDVVTNGTLAIYDNVGNKVTTVFEGLIENSIQGINFSTSNLNSGVYFATLNVGNKSITRKFTVIK
jgi:hypothetical protein